MGIDRNNSVDSIQLRLGHYALPQLNGAIRKSSRKVKGYEVQIINNVVCQLVMVPLLGWDSMNTIDTWGVHPVSNESAVINVEDRFAPGGKEPVIYATLMLWKKVGEKWSDDELVPLKTIKPFAKDGGILVTFINGSSKTIKFE